MDDHGSYSFSVLAADRKRWTLDEKLPVVFEKLEHKAAEAEIRRQEQLRAEERRRREWEVEVAAARNRYFEQKRLEWLNDQLGRWRNCRDLREFIAAARQGHPLDDEDREWLTWVEQAASDMDPLRRRLAPDKVAEPKASDLQPFMRRFSPYGP